MESIWLQKIAQKSRKSIYLFKERKLEKVIELGPPLFFNFRGGHTSSTFSNFCSFLRYAFLGLKFTFQNNDFWEKSFYYSSFYTKKLSFGHWSTIFWENRPTLLSYHCTYLCERKIWVISPNHRTTAISWKLFQNCKLWLWIICKHRLDHRPHSYPFRLD